MEEAEKKAPEVEYNFREMDSLSVPYTQVPPNPTHAHAHAHAAPFG